MVSMIGEGLDYNREAVWLAAYMHDWGGYTPWITPGVEHQTRSAEVAREFLTERGCPEELMNLVIECIEFHHGGSPDRSIESKLLTDADALDLLGVVGSLRIFAMVPRNLKGAAAAWNKYTGWSIKALSFDKSRQMAEKRIQETRQLMATFEEETFGIY